MKRLLTAALLAPVLLAGCGGGGGNEFASEQDAGGLDMAAPAPVARTAPPPPPPPPPPPAPRGPGEAEPAPEAGAQFIAYSHSLGLRLPVDRVEPVMMAHVAACQSAGTAVCIVTRSDLNNQSDDYVSASLTLRARPDWIETFLAGIDAEAEGAGGEVSYRNTSAEDLTRVIIDTDARLGAQKTLQSRLETLLESREGTLSDLLAIERELARVTAEIESIESSLRALRLRVSMSQLSVGYETRYSPTAPQRFNPLGAALGDFFYNLSSGLAGVITAFAVGLPWLFLLGLMLFIWLRLIWPRIRRKKS